jgi:hypothetical protein
VQRKEIARAKACVYSLNLERIYLVVHLAHIKLFWKKVFQRAVPSHAMIHAKYLVTYWYPKGRRAKVVNEKLNVYFAEIARPYSTVTFWCRKLKLKNYILVVIIRPGRPLEVDLDDYILDALNELPFHGLQLLSRVLKRSLSTICDHLVRKGFAVKHLKWVPHALTPHDSGQGLELSEGLLKSLAAARRDL